MPRTDDGRAASRRPAAVLTASTAVLAAALALGASGCASLHATNAADAKPTSTSTAASADPRSDPGCVDALKAISRYGPSSVKLMAEGREAVSKAVVQVFVNALDSAAAAANQPQVKSDISTLAKAYDDYFNLTTDVGTVPLEVLLKDTVDLQGLCSE